MTSESGSKQAPAAQGLLVLFRLFVAGKIFFFAKQSHLTFRGAARHERASIPEARPAERHYWRDLWAYRALFAILASRDVAVRYKRTVIGVVWAFVWLFLTMGSSQGGE